MSDEMDPAMIERVARAIGDVPTTLTMIPEAKAALTALTLADASALVARLSGGASVVVPRAKLDALAAEAWQAGIEASTAYEWGSTYMGASREEIVRGWMDDIAEAPAQGDAT